MKPRPLCVDDLDTIAANGCTVPGCNHDHDGVLYLHSRCHPYSPIDVRYRFGTGILEAICKECGEPIVDIAVCPSVPPTTQNVQGN